MTLEANTSDFDILQMMVDDYKEHQQLIKKDDQFCASSSEADENELDMRLEIDQLRAEVSGLQTLLKSAHRVGYDAGYFEGRFNDTDKNKGVDVR